MIALLKFGIGYCFCSIQDVPRLELVEQSVTPWEEYDTFHESTHRGVTSLQEAFEESHAESRRQVTALQDAIETQQVKIQELLATVSRLQEATCSQPADSIGVQVRYLENPC